jgi:tRNA pseudouridine13 synthase
MVELPYLTAGLPGSGGTLRARPEDFEVDERPAYPPSGHGDHVFVRIEKRGLGTMDAIRLVARGARVPERDIGFAGMKDRWAITRQWLSVPAPATPEQLAGLAFATAPEAELRLLEATRHPHKLRTGHLVGNRFRLTVRDLACPAAEAARRAGEVLARLAEAPGAPNWYGEQRFGRGGDNPRIGRALLAGQGGPRGRERRLYVSALQSELFNELLRRRLADGSFARVLDGDLLHKTDSGATFASTDAATDQARLERGEVGITGAMFGHEMRAPRPGSAAAELEAAVLADAGLTLDDFRRVGKLALGTRRPLAVRPTAVEVTSEGDALVVAFALPAGAYATAIAREILKSDARPAEPAAPRPEGDVVRS